MSDWIAVPRPEETADYAKYRARLDRAERLTRWMRRIPFVGSLVYVFWYSILDEGVRGAVKPRWGSLTFTFLNDGYSPSVWHTLYEITHDNAAPLSGTYTEGAPRSRREAEAVVAGQDPRYPNYGKGGGGDGRI